MAELVQFEVGCYWNQLVAPRWWPRYRYRLGQKEVVVTNSGGRRTAANAPVDGMYISLEAMTYYVMRGDFVTERGVCKRVP